MRNIALTSPQSMRWVIGVNSFFGWLCAAKNELIPFSARYTERRRTTKLTCPARSVTYTSRKTNMRAGSGAASGAARPVACLLGPDEILQEVLDLAEIFFIGVEDGRDLVGVGLIGDEDVRLADDRRPL